MSKVQVYTKGYCPHCKKAKETLRGLSVNFEEFDITNDDRKALEMRTRSNRRTVPQVFIDNHHVGGNDDLQSALRNGTLAKLLKAR